MRRVALAALAALGVVAGCARAPDPAPAGFRRAGAPIASAVLIDQARLAGVWHQVGHFPGACPGARTDLTPVEGGLSLRATCGGRAHEASWRATAPGRFATPSGPVWVLWVDSGYRTLVLGRPDGQWGAIWNRDPQIPADRLRAARELLDFNGYDTSQLQED